MAKAKILIIEDDPDISGLLGLRLKRNDYDTAFASDAVTAMTVARKERPDLILLDISLPGMDGVEVLSRIRADERLRDLPVIALTAHAMAGEREKYLGAGFDDYIAKPIVDERVLLGAIARCLRERS